MILSSDDKDKKGVVTTKGERNKAKEFFENPLHTNAKTATDMLAATVYLDKNGATASGVIMYEDDTDAYVLTAKHILYLAAGDKSPASGKTPQDYVQNYIGAKISLTMLNY